MNAYYSTGDIRIMLNFALLIWLTSYELLCSFDNTINCMEVVLTLVVFLLSDSHTISIQLCCFWDKVVSIATIIVIVLKKREHSG